MTNPLLWGFCVCIVFVQTAHNILCRRNIPQLNALCFFAFSPTHTQADEFTVDDRFLDLISKTQGRRLDDQRTTLPLDEIPREKSAVGHSQTSSSEEDDLFEALWRFQSSTRIEDQRCQMPNGAAPPHVMPQSNWEETEAECLSSDELFEMIFRCQVRIDL